MNTNQQIALEVAREVGMEVTDLLLNDVALNTTATKLLAFVNAYNARISEPVGYMTEPSLNNLINGNDVILGRENTDRSYGEMHRKIAVFLAPQPPKAELTDEYNAQQARIDALEKEIAALKESKDVKGLDN